MVGCSYPCARTRAGATGVGAMGHKIRRMGPRVLRAALVFAMLAIASPVSPAAFAAKPPPANPVLNTISAPYGAPGSTLVLTGSGFGLRPSGDDVVFGGGVKGVTYAEWSDTRISVLVPSGAAQGGVYVYVDKVSSNALPFTPWGPPTLSAVTPNTSPIGSQVVLTGSGFGSAQGTSTVRFAGTSAGAAVSWSDTTITVTVTFPAAHDG
ncbi:MAG: hypothetical protein FDZ70_10035, partial [Actinobacteria bacterium]